MSRCEECQFPLKHYEHILCSSCQCRLYEQMCWPGVQQLLWHTHTMAGLADPDPLRQAWNALFGTSLLSDPPCVSHHDPTDRILHTSRLWTEFAARVQRYETLANAGWCGVALEFHMLLLRAIAQRRFHRRSLQRRFHFDVRRRARRGPLLSPFTRDDYMRLMEGVQLHNLYDGVFHACLKAISEAQALGNGLLPTLKSAVSAMRYSLFQCLPEFIARQLDSPFTWERDDATVNLSGWVRPQIRMYPSHRRVLSEDGDPRSVLLSRLPEYVLQAHRDGIRETDELCNHIRRLVDQARRKPRKRRTCTAPLPEQEPSFERLAAQAEARQQLAELEKNANLSPRQLEVYTLRMQGMRLRDIAVQLGVSVGTVKTLYSRAKKKLRCSNGA